MQSTKQTEGRVISRQIAERIPWHLTNVEIAESYGTTPRAIWLWRRKLGKLNVPSRKGPSRKDRAHWDWSLPIAQLAKIHGVTRQRVYQIKKMMAGSPARPAIMHERW